MPNAAVIEAITTYDRRHVGALRAVAEAAPLSEEAVATVLDHCASSLPARRIAASWLLKAIAERGQALEGENLRRFVGLLGQFKTWESHLHVCQAIGHWPVDQDILEPVLEFLRRDLLHSSTLVRVWALDGLMRLADQHPQLEDVALDALKAAREDKSASMQARIRHILEERPALAERL